MNKSYVRFLFPHVVQRIGWGVFIFSCLLLICIISLWDVFPISSELFKIFILTLYFSMPVSMFLVGFSKEKHEDEYIMNIRTESLLISFYICIFISFIAQIVFYYGLLCLDKQRDFLFWTRTKLFAEPFIIMFILYIAMFRIRLFIAKRRLRNE